MASWNIIIWSRCRTSSSTTTSFSYISSHKDQLHHIKEIERSSDLSAFYNLMMREHGLYTRAIKDRDLLRLPIKLCEMLDYEESVIKKHTKAKSKTLVSYFCGVAVQKKNYFVDDEFVKAFTKMRPEERVELYCKTISFLTQISREAIDPPFSIQNLVFENVQLKDGGFGRRWSEGSLRLNLDEGTLEHSGKRNLVIDMHEYLLRMSSNQTSPAFVVEAIKPGFEESFRFTLADFSNCFLAVMTLSEKCLFQNLKKELQVVKEFRLALPEDNEKVTLLQSQVNAKKGEEIDVLLNSYINELNPLCLSCGKISVDEFLSRYALLDADIYDSVELLPSPYKQKVLSNPQNYASTSELSESLQQLKEDSFIFRLSKVYECPIQLVMACLSDVQFFEKWNPQIKTSCIISSINNQNSLIIQEIHKPIVKYYEARIFIYLRTVFVKGGVIHIVDRPLECPKQGGFQHFMVGKVEFRVLRLSKVSSNRTMINGVVKMNQRIIKNREMEIKLTGGYMEGFLRLDQYFSGSAYRQVSFFNLDFGEDQFLKFLQVINKPSHTTTVNQKSEPTVDPSNSRKKQEFKKVPFQYENDSFYSATGAEDWNSRVLTLSKKDASFRGVESQVVRSSKIASTHILPQMVVPIMETPSNASSFSVAKEQASVLVNLNKQSNKPSTHIKTSLVKSVYKPEHQNMSSIPLEVSQIVTHSNNQTFKTPLTKDKPSQDEIYATHMVSRAPVPLSPDGYCVIPQQYLKMAFPIIPKSSQEYRKAVGPNWDYYLLRDLWTILPTGQLKCINEPILKQQNGIFSQLCKKLASNILSGKGLNLSLPVDIFSEFSNLELICRSLSFGPLFLEKAAMSVDPMERIKLVICFNMGCSLAYLEMTKPFNPILGETYQGWINGCPCYCEQISHHPAVSSYLVIGRGYRIHGTITPQIDLSMNSAVGSNQGECVIEFDKYPDHTISVRSGGGEIQGLAYGDRKFSYIGKSYCYDNKGHYGEMMFNPYKKSMFSFGKQVKEVDIVEGNIFQVPQDQIDSFRAKFNKEGIAKKYLNNSLSRISGRYTQAILFDQKVYFDVVKQEPCCLEQERYPLASQCNYREDIIYKRRNDIPRAQKEKERLEELQRRDKKLRPAHK